MQSIGQKKNKSLRKMLQCYNYKSVQHVRDSLMIRWGETIVGEFRLAI